MTVIADEEVQGAEGFDTKQYSASDGLILSYRDYGQKSRDKVPVMCLAGLTRNSVDFHETALRLARHLCTTDEFWLRLQAAHDLENTRRQLGERINHDVAPRRTGTVVRVSPAKGCD